MKDHLETAPVIDAVRAHAGCPICILRNQIERQSVERYLGGAVMEPDIRLKTNAAGFCRMHHQQLMALKDYHGYALMMQTRLKEVINNLEPSLQKLSSGGVFERKNARLARSLAMSSSSRCLVCEGLEDTINRYMDIFMKLYREDTAFRRDFAECSGICLIDLPLVLDRAESGLPPQLRRTFLECVSKQTLNGLNTAQQDLDALCSSFHYGSPEKDNPRIHSALERAVNLLRGKTFDT